MCNSPTSSPVALAGAGNHTTIAWSILAPLLSFKFLTVACRGLGSGVPASASMAVDAWGPETRTTAMAERPGAVETA